MTIEEPVWVNEVRSSTFDLADLPDDIEASLIAYLDLEYAVETDESPFTLRYVGEFSLWGKPIRCWDYGNPDLYVTVQPYADRCYIGLTAKEVGDA